jgi:hypothetical protein
MPTAEGPKPQPDRPQPQPQQEETSAPAEKPTPDDATAAQDPVPLPPERLAAAIEPPPQAEKFAIALAGASSIEVARLQWAAVKANFGSMLATLKPRAVSERRGAATHYRLVAGPLPTYDAAARLCARIIAAHAICQPVKYGGEPL